MHKSDGRVIQFAGETWYAQIGRGGPQFNDWSDSKRNVFVDDQGLHLGISKDSDGLWYSSEVKSERTFGYGRYRFFVSTPISLLDAYVVIGMFFHSDDTNEIDIEITSNFDHPQTEVDPKLRRLYHSVQFPESREWSEQMALIPPHYDPTKGDRTTHELVWEPGKITWTTYYGHVVDPSSSIECGKTIYDKTPQPIPGKCNLRLNFWLVNPDYEASNAPPKGPLDGRDVELIVEDITFLGGY